MTDQHDPLREILSSSWFNTVSHDVTDRFADEDLISLGREIVVDALRVKPQLPFVREMLDARPTLGATLARAVDDRVHDPIEIFKECGKAMTIANTVIVEL